MRLAGTTLHRALRASNPHHRKMPQQYHTFDDIPTLTSLYASKTLTPTTTAPTPLQHIPTPSRTPAFNSRLSLLKTDITALPLTAIVNAANSSLLGGGGVDGAIHRAAGPRLLDECETLGGCETGDAKISGGWELPARFVVHAVGPMYGVERRREEGREERLLSSCYTQSLELVRGVGEGRICGGGEEGEAVYVGEQDKAEKGKLSIGFSGLSTGIYGYPKAAAAKVAIASVLKWLDERDKEGVVERVVFVCFEQADYNAYIELLPQFCPPAEEASKVETSTRAADDGDSTEEAGKDAPKLDLPDVPTTEPKLPDQPDAKKVKTTHDDKS